MFVSLCRAAGVPAREVFGIRQGKKEEQDITNWQHCWAEFYLPGYDWVSVDPADVRKMMLKQDLKLGDAKTKYYREYFWGGWDQFRVKLAMGRDLVLNPAQHGATVNTFGYPLPRLVTRLLTGLIRLFLSILSPSANKHSSECRGSWLKPCIFLVFVKGIYAHCL